MSKRNKIVIQSGENALKALRTLAQPLVWRVIKFIETNHEVYPSRLAKELKISPATATRKLQDLSSLNLVSSHWKIDNSEGADRPVKIYEIVHSNMRYEVNIGSPAGEAVLTKASKNLRDSNMIWVEFTGECYAEHNARGNRRSFCTVDDQPIVFKDVRAQLIGEIQRRRKIRLSDLANKKPFSQDHSALKKSLKEFLSHGVITIYEQ